LDSPRHARHVRRRVSMGSLHPCGGIALTAAARSHLVDRLKRAGARYLYGPAFREATQEMDVAQWDSARVIRERQRACIERLLHTAHDSCTFQRARLEQAGWPLTSATFSGLAPVTRLDLERHSAAARRPRAAFALRRSSGGSSGAAFSIPIDRDAYAWYMAGTWRGLRWWGADWTMPAVLLLGRSSGSVAYRALARMKDWLMCWRRVPVDGAFDRTAGDVLAKIEAFAPVFLYGYPSAVHRLAQSVPTRGWHPRRSLQVIALTGEPVYGFQRRAIEDAFGCPVAEEYGSGELGCMAFQCPQGTLHITAESVFLELVPAPANGTARAILATHLHNHVFPLIR